MSQQVKCCFMCGACNDDDDWQNACEYSPNGLHITGERIAVNAIPRDFASDVSVRESEIAVIQNVLNSHILGSKQLLEIINMIAILFDYGAGLSGVKRGIMREYAEMIDFHNLKELYPEVFK